MTGPKGNSECFLRCLDLCSTSYRSQNLLKQYVMQCSVQLQTKILKISLRRSCSPKYAEFGHITRLFCTRRLRNVQRLMTHAHRHCSACCSRCRCRRGLLNKTAKKTAQWVLFCRNTLTWTEAIEIYTLNDVTSSSSRKTTIAFFANFGWIEKLFCVPEQSLN